MKVLKSTIEAIGQLDSEAMEAARKRIDSLIKPIGSLGRIEDLAVQLAGITGEIAPGFDKKLIVVMSADHGVYEEGIAPNPQIITAIHTPNFAKGVTGVNAFAKQAGSEVIVVDIGIAADVDYPGVIQRKVKYGTDNMAKGPAMSREEAIKALEIGIEITGDAIKNGVRLVGTGEMGIGNTTASTAIIAVAGGFDPSDIVGVGAGLPLDKLEHKASVIKRAIELNKPDSNDGIDILAKVGGLEIAGMAGTMLAAAANRVPVVIDGYISTAAAIVAYKIQPGIKPFLIASHMTAENGGRRGLELLGLSPMFDMGLRLGEGTGAALAFNFIEAAICMVKEMITFEEAGIEL